MIIIYCLQCLKLVDWINSFLNTINVSANTLKNYIFLLVAYQENLLMALTINNAPLKIPIHYLVSLLNFKISHSHYFFHMFQHFFNSIIFWYFDLWVLPCHNKNRKFTVAMFYYFIRYSDAMTLLFNKLQNVCSLLKVFVDKLIGFIRNFGNISSCN